MRGSQSVCEKRCGKNCAPTHLSNPTLYICKPRPSRRHPHSTRARFKGGGAADRAQTLTGQFGQSLCAARRSQAGQESSRQFLRFLETRLAFHHSVDEGATVAHPTEWTTGPASTCNHVRCLCCCIQKTRQESFRSLPNLF